MLFGLNPEPYYWAGIALHGIVSILVYFLVFQLTKSSTAAWAAGIFFAAYERHHEAIMWISAANETILTLNCIVFLLLWKRAADSNSRVCLVSAHLMFAAALFSKEAAVVLVPIAALQLLLAGYSFRAVLLKSIPLLLLLGTFTFVWLAAAQRNFFLTDGHYALGWHFVPVYARSLARLVTQMLPLIAAWIVTRRHAASADQLSMKPSAVFFAALLAVSIAPYAFLTYLDHIPSRNTYLPSVGLAGLMGILFASLYGRWRIGFRRVCVLFLGAIVSANIAYIWLKKEPQFRERAAPTRELIQVLNGQDIRDNGRFPVRVCRFPLDAWTFTEAVTRFTPYKADEIVLTDNCDVDGIAILEWDQSTGRYITNVTEDEAAVR